MCNRTVLYDLLVNDLWDHLPPYIRGCLLDNSSDGDRALLATCSTERHVAALQLARSVFKKFQDEIDQDAADKAAYEVFLQLNDRCKNWSFDESGLGPYDEVILGEFRQALWEFFNPEGQPLFSQYGIEQGVDFGPGSAPGVENETFFHKLGHSRLSATSPLIISYFDQWCNSRSSRLDAELARTLLYGSPIIKEAVNITAVPKTAKISRLVKPEPLLNMFFQKGMQKLLESRLLSYFGIDLTHQPALNAELARYGSMTGDFATLDLKSASDCLSMKLLDKFIDPQNSWWIKTMRSSEAIIPVNEANRKIDLHMVATMGNAFCFPLQTAVYASAVQAVYKSLGLRFQKAARKATVLQGSVDGQKLSTEMVPSNWGVFGDDIIVNERAVPSLTRLLSYLGFIVNQDKSFSGVYEPFRESCGADFWEGTNVRGVYCKSLKTPQDRYSLINNLVAWSIRHEIPLKGSIGYLLRHVDRRLQVPPWENPDAGIRTPLASVSSPFVVLLGKRTKGNGPDYAGSLLYRRWAARPVRDAVEPSHVDDDGVDIYGEFGDRPLGYNSAAKLIAAIKGCLRGGYLTYRVFGQVPYGMRTGIAPSWDYIPKWSDLSSIGYRWFTESRVYF
ncbi:TPA_asm: RNA-directed RNA polymerase [ssRNA phage SRR7976325_1]|uniref:RNA-directed RNA polymerase n=1 Tax=ssRNA phage SRR7976325_1 TaxID=2786696 RepID=A0A8S5L5B9_9VIRU|nr:RNA-directed RNA polymerase [ssRNA phage SRR7976325_1]DAD52779.1 TPA_asm: RNA-directed RNA polymerase [ssRNA phage SRR7976325_1]